MGFFDAMFRELGRNTGRVFSNMFFGDAWSFPIRRVGGMSGGGGCGCAGGGCLSVLLLPFKFILGVLVLPFILIYYLFAWPFYLLRWLLGR